MEDNVNAVVATIDAVMKGGSGPVVLVGHSMSGMIISAVANLTVPDAPIQPFVTPITLTAEKWGRARMALTY